MICCIAYILYILFKYGVPTSLSETYYLLPNKWDWLFSGWCVMTAVPIGIYWFTILPTNLCWMPIVIMLCLLLIGVASRYKSLCKHDYECDHSYQQNFITVIPKKKQSLKEKIKEILDGFKPKNFLRYGWAKPIHYVMSIIALVLSTVLLCITHVNAIFPMLLLYIVFIIIGSKVSGVYNPDYSLDYDNTAWIFFMEVICFLNLFMFIW